MNIFLTLLVIFGSCATGCMAITCYSCNVGNEVCSSPKLFKNPEIHGVKTVNCSGSCVTIKSTSPSDDYSKFCEPVSSQSADGCSEILALKEGSVIDAQHCWCSTDLCNFEYIPALTVFNAPTKIECLYCTTNNGTDEACSKNVTKLNPKTGVGMITCSSGSCIKRTTKLANGQVYIERSCQLKPLEGCLEEDMNLANHAPPSQLESLSGIVSSRICGCRTKYCNGQL